MEHAEYPSKESIEKISKDLNLSPESGYMQDWEYEVADDKRIPEFIAYYNDFLSGLVERISWKLAGGRYSYR